MTGSSLPAELMHRLQRLLGWEYTRTYGPADDWPGRDTPPAGAGWELNVDYGDGGHETPGRGETEYTYWRRRTGLVQRDDYGG